MTRPRAAQEVDTYERTPGRQTSSRDVAAANRAASGLLDDGATVSTLDEVLMVSPTRTERSS